VLLKYIFDLSLSREHFPTKWEMAVIVPTVKGKKATIIPLVTPDRSLF